MRERRWSRGGVAIETRADDGGAIAAGRIVGLASVFYRQEDPAGTEYELWDGVVERVRPGAFDRALKERQDVVGLFNHDPNRVLGRTSSGTMAIRKTARGLEYSIDLPETETAREVAELVKRGDVSGSSFGWIPRKIAWEREKDGTEVRWVEDVDLFDVGPVTEPAYAGTTAKAGRCANEADVLTVREEHEGWKFAEGIEKDGRAVVEKLKRAAVVEAKVRGVFQEPLPSGLAGNLGKT